MKVVLREGFNCRKAFAQFRFYGHNGENVGWLNIIDQDVGVKGNGGIGLIVTTKSYLKKRGVNKQKVTAIENYFQDWTHPTEQEAEMFHMLFGVEIPWVSIELEGE